MHLLGRLVPLFALFSFAWAQEPVSDAPDKTPSEFARFVKVGDGGHFDTAITAYKKGDVELLLFGAVHIADQNCYTTLNDRFTTCEALLYELVGPEDYRPTKNRDREGWNPISMLQTALKTSMELTFQLDEVDYTPANFVHADMTPAEFEASMAERGESILSLMLDMMMAGMKAQQDKVEQGDAEPSSSGDLVKAFQKGEGRHLLRMMFASQLEEIEAMAAGGKTGSTLLEGRNEKCLTVLQREVAAGKKKIGIYYGAAHLPHMERRLVQDLGWKKTGHEWLVAWDCTKRPDVKYDRELVKLRQRCKGELQGLAAAARKFRWAQGRSEPLPTVRGLAAAQADGTVHYAGPLQDPWNHDYVVRKRPTGSRWEVASHGPDGVHGTVDDLVMQEPRGL